MDEEDRTRMAAAIRLRQGGSADAEQAALALPAPMIAKIRAVVRAGMIQARATVVHQA